MDTSTRRSPPACFRACCRVERASAEGCACASPCSRWASAGGIAAAYAIGLTDRFRAAAVAKPVINWISKTLTGDIYTSQIDHQFPGPPWEEFEHYWKRSPLSLVGNVTTPTLLITGEDDYRTPISETEQYYQALKLRRVDTVMVRPRPPVGRS